MRLLIATAATQGSRSDDFHWCTEGELVWVHDSSGAGDGGIDRAWIGLSSHRATTTAGVRDLPFSVADLRLALRGYLESAGFTRYLQPWEVERVLDEEVGLLVRLGRRYPAGTVVERRGPYMRVRPARIGRADVA